MSNVSFNPDADGPHIRVGETVWPVRLVHHAQSRRYKLVFDGARGELRLTLPRRASPTRAMVHLLFAQDFLRADINVSHDFLAP